MSYGRHGDVIEQMRQDIRRIEQRKQESEQRFAALGKMGEEIKALESTTSSPDKTVVVTAGPGGSVRSVRVTDAALRLSAERLSQTITATIHEAVAAAARRQAGIVQSYVGGDVLERVLHTQAEELGLRVDDLPGPSSSDTPPPRAVDPDADFAENDFLSAGEQAAAATPEQNPGGSAGDAFLRSLFSDEDER